MKIDKEKIKKIKHILGLKKEKQVIELIKLGKIKINKKL